MMKYFFLACAWSLVLPTLSAANPAPITAAPIAKATTTALAPITIAPGFAITTTAIDGKAYPVVELGGQGGYNTSGDMYSFSGLLGITLASNYSTLPGGQVFPVVQLVVAEADTENFTIPGVLTFFDGGVKTSGKETTDILCTLDLGGEACSGVEGRVTGALLGVPFTNLGGIEPTLSIPQSSGGTLIIANSAQATAVEGSQSDAGGIGGGIVTAPSYTSAGLAANGDGDGIGAKMVIVNGTTEYQIMISSHATMPRTRMAAQSDHFPKSNTVFILGRSSAVKIKALSFGRIEEKSVAGR